jgi:hypothetical protein
MIAAALCLLAILDGLLVGFRAAAGRDGRIDKREYYQRAMAFGAGYAAVAVTLFAALAACLVLVNDQPRALWSAFQAAGARALWVFSPYAVVALTAIVAWLVSPRGRTLSTIVVLGPFTLARPLVILAGLIAGAAFAPSPALLALCGVIAAVMLTIEPALSRRFPVDPRLLAGPDPPP